MKTNEILKIYGTDYKQMTKQLLAAADAAAQIPSKDCRIGIKPNLVSPSDPSMGGTTHTEIVAGIIEYLREHGFEKLLILEGSWVGDRTSEAYEVAGYRTLCETYEVPFFDLQKDRYAPMDCGGMQIDVCTKLSEVDYLITVPVLKGHCQTRMTCALKNLKGLLPNKEKRQFHAWGLHKPIAHLNVGIRQDLIVVDNICGDLDFEDGGNPVVRNCIMIAQDPVLTDSYGCHLMHIPVEDVDYIGIAERLGVGSADLSKASIRVIADTPEWFDRELPGADKVMILKDAVEEIDSCSACYGYLIPALDMLKEEGRFDELLRTLQRLDVKIGIGQGYRGKSGCIGIGNCTKGFDFCIQGCPPTEHEILDGLKEFLKNHADA